MSLTVDKCLQAWTNSLRQMNAKADIVFFGDSLTYYGDFACVFQSKVVCNLGLRGDTVQGMIQRVGQVSMLEPACLFLMTGINDVGQISQMHFQSLYNKLVSTIIEQVSGVVLFMQSILPVNDCDFSVSCNNKSIIAYNKSIESIANKHNLEYLDLYSLYVVDGLMPAEKTVDGLHLRPEGYGLCYSFLRQAISKVKLANHV